MRLIWFVLKLKMCAKDDEVRGVLALERYRVITKTPPPLNCIFLTSWEQIKVIKIKQFLSLMQRKVERNGLNLSNITELSVNMF